MFPGSWKAEEWWEGGQKEVRRRRETLEEGEKEGVWGGGGGLLPAGLATPYPQQWHSNWHGHLSRQTHTHTYTDWWRCTVGAALKVEGNTQPQNHTELYTDTMTPTRPQWCSEVSRCVRVRSCSDHPPSSAGKKTSQESQLGWWRHKQRRLVQANINVTRIKYGSAHFELFPMGVQTSAGKLCGFLVNLKGQRVIPGWSRTFPTGL